MKYTDMTPEKAIETNNPVILYIAYLNKTKNGHDWNQKQLADFLDIKNSKRVSDYLNGHDTPSLTFARVHLKKMGATTEEIDWYTRKIEETVVEGHQNHYMDSTVEEKKLDKQTSFILASFPKAHKVCKTLHAVKTLSYADVKKHGTTVFDTFLQLATTGFIDNDGQTFKSKYPSYSLHSDCLSTSLVAETHDEQQKNILKKRNASIAEILHAIPAEKFEQATELVYTTLNSLSAELSAISESSTISRENVMVIKLNTIFSACWGIKKNNEDK